MPVVRDLGGVPRRCRDRLPGVRGIEVWEDELSVTGPIDVVTRQAQSEKHRDHLHRD